MWKLANWKRTDIYLVRLEKMPRESSAPMSDCTHRSGFEMHPIAAFVRLLALSKAKRVTINYAKRSV
jgi:hypothetical protein